MKVFLSIIMCMCMFIASYAKTDNISQKVSSNDSITVHMNFESSTQSIVSQMLENNNKLTMSLTTSMDQLTTAIQDGLAQSKLTKIDIVAEQLNLTPAILEKSFKKNNIIILICLLPCLAFIVYSMYSFMKDKGLDIKALLAGTAVMALFSLLGSGVLYVILTIIFNSRYFEVRNLMSALF